MRLRFAWSNARRPRHEAMLDQIVGRVADRLVAGGFDVGRRELFVMNVLSRRRVVGRPGVVHRRRQVKQIASMHRRPGRVDADRMQELLVPLPSSREVSTRGSRPGE